MTILEASERLFDWFSENDYFVMNENFSHVIPISDCVEKDKAALSLALEDLQANDLLLSSDLADDKCWVLKKPFTSFEQNVTISPPVAMALSQVVNSACQEFGDDTDFCSPSNVQEKDIRNLILLYNHRNNNEEENV